MEDERLWDKCIRFRVTIRVDKPLQRGLFVSTEAGSRSWVYFRYEKLPEFCYWCGFLGHSEKDCSERDGVGEVAHWPYDPLLRASPARTRRLCSGTQFRSTASSSQNSPMGSTSSGPSGVRRGLFLESQKVPAFPMRDSSAQSAAVDSRLEDGVSTLDPNLQCTDGAAMGCGVIPVEVVSECVQGVGLGLTVGVGGVVGPLPGPTRRRGRPRLEGGGSKKRVVGRRENGTGCAALNASALGHGSSSSTVPEVLEGGKRKSEALVLAGDGLAVVRGKQGRLLPQGGESSGDVLVLSAGAAMQPCREP